MGVIINDFEILLDPPSQTNGNQKDQTSRQQTTQPTLSPQDIERIIRHFDERRNRVRAD